MSNNQKEAKLKASTSEFVGPLLKRLELAKKQASKNSEMEKFIDLVTSEVEKNKKVIDSIGNWDWKLIGYIGKIERIIDYWIDHNIAITEWNEPTVTDLVDILNQLSLNQRANPQMVGTKPHDKSSDSPPKATYVVGESSNRSYNENEISMILKWIESVGPQAMSYLYSLAIFPEHTELKKRFLVYWWIGLGLASFWEDRKRRAEHLGEAFFAGLVKKGVLIPVYREHNQVIDRCTIHPIIFKQLISDYESKLLTSFVKREDGIWQLHNRSNVNGLLNLNEKYLNSMAITKNDDLSVVQLGRWCYKEIEVHNKAEENGSEDHIEVDETDFLKKLGENVTYLSLRGISRIEEIPQSIGKLQHLIILDLRACHNLEKLPQKPRPILKESWWFEKLMVLDISECYLLDHVPKWLCELTHLEVLKGFVVSGVPRKTQPCRVGDLSKLNKLRKLSIRISSEQLLKEDFSGLENLDKLLILTIIWRDNKNNLSLSHSNMSNDTIPTYSFPKNLEKLDIRCYPEVRGLERVNPARLTNLKRLYIRGGKLIEIPCNYNWNVEILRLRFLENLKTDWVQLRHSFENLKYVEYVECHKLTNFPMGSRWFEGDG